ncbi:unnamed protein product [Ilex paraguariensis]|uniref:Uncharacterized protein n=1 Tax=Ilex paraguariensis TaxID=185542 RepID=A0ABC8UN38_9AQUA
MALVHPDHRPSPSTLPTPTIVGSLNLCHYYSMSSNGGADRNGVKMVGRKHKRVARGSVHMKVKKLQKLIPGGYGLKPDRLLLMTADYILHLRLQINVLQALSQIYKP